MTKFQRSRTRSLVLANEAVEGKSKGSHWQVEPLLCVIVVLSAAVFLT